MTDMSDHHREVKQLTNKELILYYKDGLRYGLLGRATAASMEMDERGIAH